VSAYRLFQAVHYVQLVKILSTAYYEQNSLKNLRNFCWEACQFLRFGIFVFVSLTWKDFRLSIPGCRISSDSTVLAMSQYVGSIGPAQIVRLHYRSNDYEAHESR